MWDQSIFKHSVFGFLQKKYKKWKSVVSPVIIGFSSEVPIQTLTVRLRCLALMKNHRSGQCYSINHPSEWLSHCAFKRYCGCQNNCWGGGCQQNIPAAQWPFIIQLCSSHKFIMIAIAQAYYDISSLKTPLRSSHWPQPFWSNQENIRWFLKKPSSL